MPTTAYTKIPYYYADAANYKASAEFFVEGILTAKDIAAITTKLDSSEMFIPIQVGLESMQHVLSSFPSEDDHVWHILELSASTQCDTLPEDTSVTCTVAELVARFENVKLWDVTEEHHRLRLDE